MSFENILKKKIRTMSDMWAEQDSRISTPVQRLRWIKQLGTADMLYPTGSHTRFEHSLGTYYIAKQMLFFLKRTHQDLITEIDEENVLAAALLHDIGHVCFSHTGELFLEYCSPVKDFIAEMEKEISVHEYIGYETLGCSYMKEIIDLINHQYGKGLDTDRIRSMIIGEHRNSEKQFLAEIIHGPIDADRTDYLLRDAYNVGFPHIIDVQRLLSTLTVVEDKEGKSFYRLGVEEKGWRAVLSLFLARNRLRSTLYEHHVSRISEEILIRILRKCIRDPVSIIGIDDYHLFCRIISEKGSKSLEDYKNRKFYKRFLFFQCTDEIKKDDVGTTFEERTEIEQEISEKLWSEESCCIMVVPKKKAKPNIGEILINPREGLPKKASAVLKEEIDRGNGLMDKGESYSIRFFVPWNKIRGLHSFEKRKVKEILSQKYDIEPEYFQEVYSPKEYKAYSI
ncbi:MAG: hypothetical protein AYK18_12140 [Theionarchaea archaeon DG-70]|nr:MAG: hypothetical protein AYK18_12140 [Theionarchaea archaeon DG-70]